jgi:hypothetical protein
MRVTITARRLVTRLPRQHDLSVQELERFGPRPSCTQHLAASPPALANSESGWPAEALQIANIDPHPILAFGAAPGALASRLGLGRFDLDRHLTIGLAHVCDACAIESEHGLSEATTVSHCRDLLAVDVVEQLRLWRDPCTHRGTLTPSSLPTSTRRAPLITSSRYGPVTQLTVQTFWLLKIANPLVHRRGQKMRVM